VRERARTIVQLHGALRASRPQLKRDPRGAAALMTRYLTLAFCALLGLSACSPDDPVKAWAGRCYFLTWRDSAAALLPDSVLLDARSDSANFGSDAPAHLLRPAASDTAHWVGVAVASWVAFGSDSLGLMFLRPGAGWLARLGSRGDSLQGSATGKFTRGPVDSMSLGVAGHRIRCPHADAAGA